MKRLPRKRRTREHVLADLSVNHVERQVLLCGFVAERVTHDYGIYLELFTFNKRGEIEEGKILVQLKATDHFELRSAQTTFPIRIDRSDLVLWLAQPMPVILMVYDARKEKAYWLYVQSHFQRLKDFNLFSAGQRVTVQIPVANVLTTSAIRRFARYRNRVLEQMRKVIHDED
jgi:hypothetical protein